MYVGNISQLGNKSRVGGRGVAMGTPYISKTFREYEGFASITRGAEYSEEARSGLLPQLDQQ